MSEGRIIVLASLAGLVPWGAMAILTNWFNERQASGVQTLSVGHALILMLAQMTIMAIVFVAAKLPR